MGSWGKSGRVLTRKVRVDGRIWLYQVRRDVVVLKQPDGQRFEIPMGFFFETIGKAGSPHNIKPTDIRSFAEAKLCA